MSDNKVFHLDKWKQAWAQLVEAKLKQREAKQFADEAGELFKELSAGASQFKLNGHIVAHVIPGQLNMKKLTAEQPDIVAELTESQVTQVFNKIRFAKEYPDLFAQYQAQRLVLADDTDG